MRNDRLPRRIKSAVGRPTRVRRSVLRTLRFANGAAFVLLAAFVFAAPVQAATSTPLKISGQAVCQPDGEYQIIWSIQNNDSSGRSLKIVIVTAKPDKPLSWSQIDLVVEPHKELHGKHVAPGTATNATLQIDGEWIRKDSKAAATGRATIDLDGKCKPMTPTVEAVSTCDDFSLKISNPANASLFAVAAYGSQERTVTVAPNSSEKVTLPAGSSTEAKIQFPDLSREVSVSDQRPTGCTALPLTGGRVTSYVAGGVGLVALGVVLFFLSRRRLARLRRLVP